MPDIVFKKGQFQQFRATKEIALGGISPVSGYKTFVGEIIEFDGFKLVVGSGESAEAPHIRSAISGGWFVPHDGSHEEQPEIQVTPPPSSPRTTVVRYEDQVVSTLKDKKFQASAPGPTAVASRILEQLDQQPEEQAPAVDSGGRKKYALTRQEEFEGEGIPIGRLRPKAQEIPAQTGAEGIFEDQKEVTTNFNPSVRTEQGLGLEESARVHRRSTDSVIMGKAAVVGTNKDATPPQIRKMALRTSDNDEGVPVARMKTPTSFGSTQINASTSVASAIAQVERQARVVPGTVHHEEDPIQEVSVAKDPILETLQSMIPGFSWDKNRPARVRLAEAKKVTDPMMRRAIATYETPELQAQLQKIWA